MGDLGPWEKRHQKVMLPCVRVMTTRSGGSGTILYSREGSTFVLTNHHVVDTAIRLEKEWSSLLKSERMIDIFEIVDTHLFSYAWESRGTGARSIQSDIVCYDKNEDLALLKLRDGAGVAAAELYPKEQETALRIGMKVICIGAALGEEPVQTEGILSQFGQEIDRREYWLHTAPSIYGNSGGAMFLKDTYQMIGVPARIAVTVSGFSIDPITHLSYCVPITRVYKFLEQQRFRFIYDENFTEEGEAQERKEIREAEERKMARASGVV